MNEFAKLIDQYIDRNIQIERILKQSLDELEIIADSIVENRPDVARNIYATKNKIYKAWRKARARNINGKKYLKKLLNYSKDESKNKQKGTDRGMKYGC